MTASSPMFYLLFYEKGPDFAERQSPWQIAHRDHVVKAADRGDLLLAGSLGDPVDGSAVLVFRTDSQKIVEDFAAADPYVINGIISRWSIRPWDVVAGSARSVGPASA